MGARGGRREERGREGAGRVEQWREGVATVLIAVYDGTIAAYRERRLLVVGTTNSTHSQYQLVLLAGAAVPYYS